MHHDETVPETERIPHVVCNHQGRKLLFSNDFFRNLQHLGRSFRIKCGGVLVKEQKLRPDKRRHEERERLALAAREKADVRRHAVFKTEAEAAQERSEVFASRLLLAPAKREPPPAAVGDGEVLLDHHAGGRSAHWILEDASDEGGALVLGHARNIHAVDCDRPFVDREDAGNGVEKRRLPGAVRADHRAEVARLERKADAAERLLFVGRARKEGLVYVFDAKHFFWSFVTVT